MAEITFDDLPAAGTAALTFDDLPDASHGLKFDDLPDAKPSTPSLSDLSKGGFIAQPAGGIDTAALGEHPADPAWLASKGSINLGNVASHVISTWVDNLNTATGSTEDANKDPDIVRLRQEGNSPVVSLPKPTGDTITAGATRGVEKSLEGLTTPGNLTIMAALGGAPGIIQKAAAVGFGAMMAKDAPEKIKEALDQPTPAGKAEGIAEGIAEAAMAFGSFAHVAGRSGRIPTGQLQPTSLPEWVKQTTGQEINQANPSPASVEGLLLAKEKAGEGFFDLPKDQQTERTKIINEIDDQLKGMPTDAVKAGEERVAARAQSPPPVEGEAPPVTPGGPPAKGGTSSLFKQAQAEAGVTPPVEETSPAAVDRNSPEYAKAATTLGRFQGVAEAAAKASGATDEGLAVSEAIHGTETNPEGGLAARMARGELSPAEAKAALVDAAKKAALKQLDAQNALKRGGGNVGSLDAENETGKTAADVTPSEEATPVQQAAKEDTISAVQETVNKLPENLQKTAKAYLEAAANNGTPDITQLAKDLGVSRETVYTHLQKMQKHFKGLEDEGYSVGPGAASISEQLGRGGVNGIRNALVDEKRVDAGLPERVPVMRRTFGTIWDRAMATLDENPNAGKALVEEIKKKARPLTDQEDAILTHEQMDRQQEYDEAVHEVNEAQTDEERVRAETRLAVARDSLHEVFEAGSKAGTENARGLSARRLLVKDGYTLAKMEYDKIAANGGKKAWDALPKEVQDTKLDEVKRAHARITELEKQIETSENIRRDELAKHYFDQLIKETKSDVKKAVKQGKSFTDFTGTQAEKARARIAARRREGRFNSLPVDELVDHAIIGADYIAKGAKTLAEFSKKMIGDFGESIKPFLSEIFGKAKEFHDSNEKFFKEGPKEKEKTLAKPEEIVARAKSEAAKGELSHKTVYDLARAHVNAGVEGFENVMKAVHKDLEPLYKGITEREVRDAFSEYGKVKYPSAEADKVKLAEYRRIGQLQSAIEDALAGNAPKKSGLQRTKPTLDVREKMAELREAMAKAGIETKSPEEQLASRNEARATSLRNQIEALDKQLKTGQKPAKGQPVPESAQVEQLRAERNAMKEELKRIEEEANPPKSPEQRRLDAYKKSLQRQIDELKARQASGNYAPRPRSQLQLDQGAINLRTQRDLERQKVQEALIKDRLANRTTAAKMADAAVQWSRVVKLASVKVYPKLLEAALFRAVFEPASRVLGLPLRLINKGVFEKAYPESGASVKAVAKYIVGGLTSWGKAWEKLRTGKTDIDVASDAYKRDQEMINFVGNSHGMIKEPLRQAAFQANQQLRLEQAIRDGLDPNDPIVQTSIRSAAAESANRQIFTGDNPFTRFLVKLPINALKRSKTPGLPALGRTMEFLMPIVNVPTNIAIHTARLNPLVGFSEFAIRMADASRKGELENNAAKLSNADAELLSRVFKTAALGTVLSAYAWTHSEQFGGLFEEKNRKRTGLKPDEVKIFGVTLPGWMNHVGEMQHLNTVASARRVWDRYVKQTGKPDAAMEALAFAMMAPVKRLPFIDTYLRIFSDYKTPGQTVGAMARDAVVPGVVTQAAALTDKKERSPQTFTDELKLPIPKVREQIRAKR